MKIDYEKGRSWWTEAKSKNVISDQKIKPKQTLIEPIENHPEFEIDHFITEFLFIQWNKNMTNGRKLWMLMMSTDEPHLFGREDEAAGSHLKEELY